jgi:hypothetical protein
MEKKTAPNSSRNFHKIVLDNLLISEIGNKYGVKKGAIHAIKTGRNWGHVIYP